MRVFEVVAALLLGAVLLVALKLIGVVLKIALVGAAIGVVAGYLLARGLRRA